MRLKIALMGRAESRLRDTEMCDIISQMERKGCSAEQGIKNRNTEMGSVMGREEKDYEETDWIGICFDGICFAGDESLGSSNK